MRGKQVKIALVILAIVILGVIAFVFIQGSNTTLPFTSNNSEVSWAFDGKRWQASGTPPNCLEPLEFPAPVDVRLASGILYPGQIRGGDYRPHGGFRFDNRNDNDIEVRAIMDGYVFKASKYLEEGEEQILVFYINDCGIMVMHDHFLTLSQKLEEALSKLPLNQEGYSKTTMIEPRVSIKKWETLATEIGHKNYKGQKNIFVDFGLYDLRKKNGEKIEGEYAPYGLCWFDYFSFKDESLVRSLPAGGHEGKVSDYCK